MSGKAMNEYLPQKRQYYFEQLMRAWLEKNCPKVVAAIRAEVDARYPRKNLKNRELPQSLKKVRP